MSLGRLVISLALSTMPLLGLTALSPPSHAETFIVTDIVDAIPAPPGSLRWAIEASETNGEPDRILFAIDGGTIPLVAPLPDLTEGGVVIGDVTLAATPDVTPVTGGIIVDGRNVVERAIAIRSARNGIGELQFIRFGEQEVILIAGGDAVGNAIERCVFGDDDNSSGNAGAAIRISPGPTGTATPAGTEIRSSRFVNNGSGVVVDGNPSPDPSLAARGTVITRSRFGTAPAGGPGPGNGQAVSISGAGPVFISNCLFSGPGEGIALEAGANGSVVRDSEIGVLGGAVESCGGFSGAALRIAADRVELVSSVVRCSNVGVAIGPGANDTRISLSQIGGETPAGHATHGVTLGGASGTVIDRSSITGNGGYGIAFSPSGPVDPGSGNLFSCNSIWRNVSGAINLPGLATAAPVLTAATPIEVEGTVPNSFSGWLELFGDDADQARVFQGALRVASNQLTFRQPVPTLGLRVRTVQNGSQISFDREAPARHSATGTDEPAHETSELSVSIAADSTGLVYDLIRGDTSQLAFLPDGGIDLGAVTCLQSGIDPDIAISPDVIDPDDPAPGEAFFYLARRRATNLVRPGTYDPAVCLLFVDEFGGPRKPSSGDCG